MNIKVRKKKAKQTRVPLNYKLITLILCEKNIQIFLSEDMHCEREFKHKMHTSHYVCVSVCVEDEYRDYCEYTESKHCTNVRNSVCLMFKIGEVQ